MYFLILDISENDLNNTSKDDNQKRRETLKLNDTGII